MEKAENPRTIEDIRAAVMASPELDELRETAPRRHKLYQFMAEHPDPLWREIGQQLRDGHLRPTEVLSIPEYREQLRTGMAEGLAHLTHLVEALEDHLAADAEAQTAGAGVQENPDDDLSEAMGPILRRR